MIHDYKIREKKGLAVVSDFDGTIALTDTFEYVLRKYAQGDWGIFDEQYQRGEITLQECVKKQGRLVKAHEMVLIAEMERVTGFRPNFDKLVRYCRTNKIPVIVVSAGLDFVIKHLLRMKGWDRLVRLYAAKAESTPEGIKLTFPRLRDRTSLSLKDDTVRYYKKQRRVAYVGDGIWDLHALGEADYRFVIKGSRLASLCRQQNIPAREIDDFQEMLAALQYDLPV